MPSLQDVNYSDNNYFKSELTLNRGQFNVLDQRINKIALAQTIQNIIIFRPGNFPNQPELGVGIEDYLFELKTNETMDALRNKIESQLRRFCPTTYTIQFDINSGKKGNLFVLSIDFDIKTEAKVEEVTTFQLLFGSSNDKKIVSKLII